MSPDPLDQDGFKPIIAISLIWVAILIIQFAGFIELNLGVLYSGVFIGALIISYLLHRRYRRKRR